MTNREPTMTKLSYNRERFAAAVRDNIAGYQRITQTSNQELADCLGLSLDELDARKFDIEPWSAYELDQCAQFFKCPFGMLYPDAQGLKTDVLWGIARKLPDHSLNQLLEQAGELGKAAGINLEVPCFEMD